MATFEQCDTHLNEFVSFLEAEFNHISIYELQIKPDTYRTDVESREYYYSITLHDKPTPEVRAKLGDRFKDIPVVAHWLG